MIGIVQQEKNIGVLNLSVHCTTKPT